METRGQVRRAWSQLCPAASKGLEREARHKSASLRTYTLVGFSSALIVLASKYGFTNIRTHRRRIPARSFF
jgi:putative Mg2+ transporter-C (MgtC) family protein